MTARLDDAGQRSEGRLEVDELHRCRSHRGDRTQVGLRDSGVYWRWFSWEEPMRTTTGKRVATALVALLLMALFAAPALAVSLTITRAGSGDGGVTSSVGAIDCGAVCSDDFAVSTQITLMATPGGGSQFTGWLGPCSGTGACTFTITGTTTASATFAPLSLGTPSLDIDGNGAYDALTDGLLSLRYLFGLTGASLVQNAVGMGATRSTPMAIGAYLDDIRPTLDIDGNGQADALTDGLLIIRYLFGLRGASLVANAIAPGAPRNDTPAIEGLLAILSTAGPALPPDPSSIAPPVNPTVATDIATATAFLYTGGNPIQTGVGGGTIEPRRVAVLRGNVQNRDGTPLSGVTITVLAHPEFGQTKSRADGVFDLAVNGGGTLTVEYRKTGFLDVQRAIAAPWRDYAWLPDVAMTPVDTAVTAVNLGAPGMKIARGSPMSDADGARRTTILFPAGTTATMHLAGGGTQPMSTLSVRATEYTVGASGPKAMPGLLPPSSGYTYAAELGIDEAVAAGASSVTFNQPVPVYLENFPGFPVGGAVPAGYYDRVSGQWVAAPNGRVIKVLAIVSGVANLDIDGDAVADDATKLATIGITAAERSALGQLYSAGQTLWRVPVAHFSAWDFNWPYGPPGDADPPPSKDEDPDKDKKCKQAGSIIGCESQSLGQVLAVTGTPWRMHYESSRTPGRKDAFSVKVRLTGATIPASLRAIRLEVAIAGRLYRQQFVPAANLVHTVTWDGKDAYDRTVEGMQVAAILIHYDYPAQYYASPSSFENSFARPETAGAQISATRETSTVTLTSRSFATLGVWDARASGLGGWTMNVHHAYVPNARVLLLGDGRRRTADSITNIITTIAGNGMPGFDGDGGAATSANLAAPVGVAVGSDGSTYIADAAVFRIRRVSPSGIITNFAGTGMLGSGGDNGPATAAQFSQPRSVAFGPDGSLYVADSSNHKVRRVRPDGIIVNVAGNGSAGFAGDGGPATSAQLNLPFGVAVGADGSVFIADTVNSRIRRVAPDGVITTLAGTGDADFGGDNGPAVMAMLSLPQGVAVAADGSVMIADSGNNRVRRVLSNGTIVTVAGTGSSGSGGDGGPATLADLSAQGVAMRPDGSLLIADVDNARIRRVAPDGIISTLAGNGVADFGGDRGFAGAASLQQPSGLTVAPDGSVVIADTGNFRIRRVAFALPSFAATDLLFPAEDLSELYVFNASGKHLSTLDALTGSTRHQFGYDAAGYLVSITDMSGNVTSITRNGAVATGITSPGGQVTGLNITGGWLTGQSNPLGDGHAMAYTPDGLMQTFTDPRSKIHTLTYDAMGRLTKDEDPAGGSTTLARTEQADGFTVTATTALGRVRSYQVQKLPDNAIKRTVTAPGGAQTVTVANSDGTELTTFADGTTMTTTYAPDPRFGVLAAFASDVVVATPGGHTRTIATTRSVSLSDPNNLLSLSNFTETTSVNGAVSTRAYVSNGVTRTLTTTTAAGRQTITNFDALGRVIKSQVPGLEPYGYSYEARGLLAAITEGTGGSSRTTSFAYNARYELTGITDPLGRAVGLTYDDAGRVASETLPGSRVVGFAYDASGNVTAFTPPGRTAHAFGFDPIDNVASYTPPMVGGGGTTTQLTYNADHAMVTKSRPDGLSVTATYDAAGRTSVVGLARGPVGYTYDASGRLNGVVAPGGLGLAYTRDGHLLTEASRSGAVTGTVAYTYDDNFRLATESVNGANGVSFTYDGDGRVTAAGSLTLARDVQSGLLTGLTLGNVSDERSYDTFAEPLQRVTRYNGNSIYSAAYTHDKARRITQTVETIGGTSTTYGYAYDAAGRLAAVTKDGNPASSYTYDLNGNRTASTGPGGPLTATYDGQDRLVSHGTTSYAFNAAGDLTSKTEAALVTTYEYDELRNLLKVTLPGGPVIDYLVDGANRRIGKKVNGTLAQGFLYQGALRLIAELDGANAVVSRFVYAGNANVPAYMIKGGATYRIVTDRLGSPRLVVDTATGAIAQRIDYDEFGQVLSDTNPGFQPFGYAGGLYDHHTKLVRFGLRDYDAHTGRWTTKDPIGFRGRDPNVYAYAANNPLRYTDPIGLAVGDWWDFPSNIQRTREIAAEELAKRRINAHNNIDDALRHSEWMRRTTAETNVCVAFIAGTGHEIEGMLEGQPMDEMIMDLHNNAVGRDAGSNGTSVDPADLVTLDSGPPSQGTASQAVQSFLNAALALALSF
jgi:RHS repeat-associated protein